MDRFAWRFIRALLLPLLHLDRSGPLLLVRHFSSNEIKKATENFSKIVRSGSHGVIYKAHFSNGLVAAVREIRDFGREKDAFYREVLLLGCLHHRHLVALKGFSTGHNRFLVFDYMENGSLKEHLHDPLKTPLDWRTRLQIAVDVAAALEYLQFFCDPPVYHVSINSSNILLDENFVAKISPMGFLDSDSYHMARSSATCSRHTDQTCRCIIFQFGVLILELVTGQSLGNEGTDLVEWVQESIFSSSMHRLVDADLGDRYDTRQLKSLLTIARMCTHGEGNPLVSIPQILRYLQRKIEPLVPSI